MTKGEMAEKYFKEGYNCTQAVFGAFVEETGMDFDQAMIYSCGFGGGVGRMREVCGAVSGMVMVISILYGSSNPKEKNDIYKRVQEVCNEFKEQNGTIVCKELLGLVKREPTTDTEKPYKKTPCIELVRQSATIVENYIARNSK